MNHIVIMGRLTSDPELRETQSGTPVAHFSLAVSRPYAPKDGGERQTDFIDVVAWRGTAQFVSKYFTKGQMAAVAGRLQISDWVDKENNKRRKAEVVAENIYFTESKKSRESGGGSINPKDGFTTADMTPVESSDFVELEEDDEELPF